MTEIPDYWQWFADARFGQFIHWGAYSQYGRGEQVLFRDHLDQNEYVSRACAWNPQQFDAMEWADVSRRAGMRYAVLTTRHHDGFCLWDCAHTDYSTAKQAAGRDLVAEYVEAFRAAGLRIGLYYSLADWRIPAYWEGPEHDAAGWDRFRDYVHRQVEELLSNYGKIDLIWFDGAWPHSAERWGSYELIEKMRTLQPEILINNRLGKPETPTASADGGAGAGEMKELGDFGTPEHHITAETGRMWESCQVSTWRLWGYTSGEYWRPAELLLDMLVEAASKGGNLLLNVGPDPEGRYPDEYIIRAEVIGEWMERHGEAIYGSEPGEVCEFIASGRQTRKGNNLYLIVRFWGPTGEITLGGLQTRVKRAVLLSTGEEVQFLQTDEHVTLTGLPIERPTELFPVIRLECEGPPEACDWAKDRLWGGDPRRMTPWAAARGTSVWADGRDR